MLIREYIDFVRDIYPEKEIIPLHEPCFSGNEKLYVNECIDSTYVSNVGKFVDRFERMVENYTNSKYAIATVNGTAALHIALLIVGVQTGDEVITQPLTFVATVNAISYLGAYPVFVDIDNKTLGLSPEKLDEFLSTNTFMAKGKCINKRTGRCIKACIPMHTYGHPCRIDHIKSICKKNGIVLVEDAAESLGSKYKNKHTGTFGEVGIFSFNGNKTITSGGGGMIVTNDNKLAQRAKHVTTTAKVHHKWEYIHDQIGYNYRLPNINAALGCAQMECLDIFIKNKRGLAKKYEAFFKESEIQFFQEPKDSYSNYWLNVIVFKNKSSRDHFLEQTNANSIITRPAWRLINKLKMYSNYQVVSSENAQWFENRIVNIPSSVYIK